jgi:7-cyano-7-deazaguanine synthase
MHLGLQASDGQPDLLREWLHACGVLVGTLSAQRTKTIVEAPLMDLSYADIIRLGTRFRIPFERTWTCDAGDSHPCGVCERCKARDRAFLNAREVDPLLRAVPA